MEKAAGLFQPCATRWCVRRNGLRVAYGRIRRRAGAVAVVCYRTSIRVVGGRFALLKEP